jgi:PPOX class probable F420-dependent enzyme
VINVPASYNDLLADDTKAFAYLATLMSNGFPQVTPVWFNVEGDYILINTVQGRIKDKNMRSRPKVALVIADPSNPYRYMQIRGTVVESTTLGAEEHIDTLNFKYHGKPLYANHSPQRPRVIYKIKPDKVQAY